MGIGPLVAWRRASLRSLGRILGLAGGRRARHRRRAARARRRVLGAGARRIHVLRLRARRRSSIEFARGHARAAARSAAAPGRARSRPSSARNRRRYGGYVVHAAIVLLAIGVAGSSVYETTREAKLAAGPVDGVGGYTLVYRSLATREAANHTRDPGRRRPLSRRRASSGRSSRGRTTTRSSSRCRTRWRSTRTGSAPRTST